MHRIFKKANFHFTFKMHVVVGKTQVLHFLPVLRELSMFRFLILKFRLFRVTNSPKSGKNILSISPCSQPL